MLELFVSIINAVTLFAVGAGSRQVRRMYSDFNPSKQHPEKIADNMLPSVTVCIPARNEDHALTDCLQSVLSSNYPKLEVIVLDDNSVDNTSVLIKSFAHEGVRFIAGTSLPGGWLGKNYALQGLQQQASGSYILFLDVDTRLKPDSIRQTVSYALSSDAAMVSVMPRREDGLRASVFFAPLRYFWEVSFHTKLSPAAAGNAWLVDSKKLKEYGGLATLKDSTKPESHLASYFASKGKYGFLVSDARLGVSYEKKWTSQLDTSTRLLYPMMGRQWATAVIAVIDLLIFLMPLAFVATLYGQIEPFFWYVSLFTSLAVSTLYTFYANRAWRSGWVLAFFIWPYTVLQEAALVVVSLIKYSRNKVTWKGRPVRSEDQS